ncbi:MAG TPA: Type 1 glutamine amidotransferase-like domain-containing protein [Gemmatimonadales bacterium]|nr:Type 1 glutamine amidotransferase-like domain-containing protein [Gemmatimonadales bacterium]
MPVSAFALLGSGEFESWTSSVDAWLLERASGDGRILILPTASAPEGASVFDRWARMGLEHYERQGMRADVVPLRDRDDAADPALVAALREASVVFFSGGNPAYLAGTLEGTPAWEAIVEGLGRGMAYAGCSAGVACLGEGAPDSAQRDPNGEGFMRPGLGLFPATYFMPHWDALNTYIPGLRELLRAAVPDGRRIVTIDENTAMVGDGAEWSILGAGSVGLVHEGSERTYGAGETFAEALAPRTAPGNATGG